jgi:hypothetical protein
MSRFAADDGFTVAELLVAMAVGMIVLLASALTLDNTLSATATVQRRVDANQRGRAAMDDIVRELRSQVCLTTEWVADADKSSPLRVAAAGPTTTAPTADGTQSIAFYADLQKTAAYQSSKPAPPELRVITFDGAAFRIREDIYTPTVVNKVAVYPATPTKRAVLLSGADRTVDAATKQKLPIFRFYRYDAAAVPPQPTLEVLPWTADADKVSKVSVAFNSRPTSPGGSAGQDTVLTDDVYVREVDPYDASHAPKC